MDGETIECTQIFTLPVESETQDWILQWHKFKKWLETTFETT